MSVSTGTLLNPGEYQKKVESVRVSTKLSELVRKNGRLSVSTRKLLNPSEYREKVESVRVPKNCPD